MAISAEKKVVMVKNGEIVNFKRVHYGEMFLWSGALWMKVWNGKREGDNAVVIDGNLLIPTYEKLLIFVFRCGIISIQSREGRTATAIPKKRPPIKKINNI